MKCDRTTFSVRDSIQNYNKLIPLKEAGILTYKFGRGEYIDKHLRDFAIKELLPQMETSAYDKIYAKLNTLPRERKDGIIYLMTEKSIAMYNAMISNVVSEEERTSSIKLLYTDDADFDIYDLFEYVVDNKESLDKIIKGDKTFIKSDKTYVIKVVSELFHGRFTETVRDYLIFIPERDLI